MKILSTFLDTVCMVWIFVVVIMACPTPAVHAKRRVGNSALLQKHAHMFPNVVQPALEDKRKQPLIPRQLIMTGVFDSLQDFPTSAMVNLNKTRALAPGLTLRYLNDRDCRRYLAENFVSMIKFYDEEHHGSFRGDICRSAVLLREGGFYADLDFEFYVPLPKLIDDDTTFMTIRAGTFAWDRLILNALIAVKPDNPIMHLTMSKMKEWYAGSRKRLLGPLVMSQAITEIMEHRCPEVAFLDYDKARDGHVACGAENMLFYQELDLGWGQNCAQHGDVVCPKKRETDDFRGAHMGVFSMGKGNLENRLIGWPRYLGCSTFGCDISGGVPANDTGS